MIYNLTARICSKDAWKPDPDIVQVNLIIRLSLGSMETDRVITEPCYV